MPSFAHKKLVERIAHLGEPPTEIAAYAEWIKAGEHLSLLRENANEGEIIIYASGRYAFIHSALVSNDRLSPVDKRDLLGWNCYPHASAASYAWGGGHEGIWIERGMHNSGAKTLEGAQQLAFERFFEGWTGDGRTYCEILQEYAHLTDIHWRPEQHAYCRFDERGDIDHVVSITKRDDKQSVTLVSFERESLECYLEASNSTLIRIFDFTLFRPENFSRWPDGPEDIVEEGDNFFYRQKISGRHAAYTRGVQIVRPSRSRTEVFSSMTSGWAGRRDKSYVEFIAYDWRHGRVANISTDPSVTTNYFEARDNDLPFEISPAFFRSEVLLKYKGDRDKYKIDTRDIHCRGAWTLRGYDVNDAGQVHAYICYLRSIPYSEQLYWKSYNEPPKAGISHRAFVSDFEGAFSTQRDSLQKLLSTVRRWADTKVPWWELRENRLLERVSTPHTASRDEWAEAFMDLSKLIIEGFDIKFIRTKLVQSNVIFEKNDGSLVLLEKLMSSDPVPLGTQKLEGLRIVQSIRSKVKGHSGGGQAMQLAQDALKQHGTYAAHFEHICESVASELESIERLFS